MQSIRLHLIIISPKTEMLFLESINAVYPPCLIKMDTLKSL